MKRSVDMSKDLSPLVTHGSCHGPFFASPAQ
jgi:hypothetical protein